jgi:arabinofuranosyltransferase
VDAKATTLAWRRLLPLLLALGLAVAGVTATLYLPAGAPMSSEHAEGLDDAYISYRYALNLVEGHGLVFNPGEKVEGFSNLLWVLAAAALLKFCPPSMIHFAVCGLNVLLAVAGLLVLHGEVRRRHGEWRGLAAAALWAAYPFLWQWISSGLEAIAVVLVQLLIWRTLSREEIEPPWRGLALWLTLAVLLRTDGFVTVFLVAGHFLLNRRPAHAGRAILLGLPSIVALFGFRLAYYQDVWPSTYYVKIAQPLLVRMAGGFERLAELLFGFLLAPFLLALLWLAWRTVAGWLEARPPGFFLRTFRVPPEFSLSLGLLAYWIYIGGDHFRIRFLLVLFPLAAAVIFGPLAEGLSRDRQVLLFAVLLAACAGLVYSQRDFRLQKERYDGWIELGNFLGRNYPGALLAAEAVGKTPYFSRLRTIDMYGLCDAHIAKLPPVREASPGHEKSDPAYVLSRRPDLIVGHLLPNMMVRPDLSEEMYTAAGYRLAYLLNLANESQQPNIVPAPDNRRDAWAAIFRGYSYAVLVRDPQGRPQQPLR